MNRKSARRLPAALLPTALLAGCIGGPAGDYPSLAIRDAERVAGTLSAPEPYIAPPPAPATLNRLSALESEAEAAHAAFLTEAPRASSLVAAARGASTGSEEWARAEVALATLIAGRSRTMVPLAELDRILVEAATEGRSLDAIASVRDAVEAHVAAENATIGALEQVLAR